MNLLMSTLIPEHQTIFVNQLMLQNGFSEYLLNLQNMNPQVCSVPVTPTPTSEFEDLLRNLKSDGKAPFKHSEEKEWNAVKAEDSEETMGEEEVLYIEVLGKPEEKEKSSQQSKHQSSSLKTEVKQKNNNLGSEKVIVSAPIPSIAPWSAAAVSNTNSPISLAEIQKAERRERRHEEQQKSYEQSASETKDNITWTKILPPSTRTKSFAEIQAEEAKEVAAVAEQQKKQRYEDLTTNVASATEVNWATAWKVVPVREQNPPLTKRKDIIVKKKIVEERKIVDQSEKQQKKDDGQTEFLNWCYKSLTNLNPKIDGILKYYFIY